MCGIAGLIGDFPNPEILLQQMKDCLLHRGPDQEGMFSSNDDRVYLGHRRLSILDLSAKAKQPMVSNQAVLVCNGEIYNFQELRNQLNDNYNFSSTSDTEVLLHGYAKWGIKGLLLKIKGMFSFAIYDRYKHKLYLARDRMGEKPIYFFSDHKKRFAFASELKAMQYIPDAREIDYDALNLYFTFGYVPAPKCIVKNCYKLMPAHYLEMDLVNGNYDIKKYWSLNPAKPKINVAEDDAADKILELLKHSISISMFSDVPLGVFLSGGLDSSIISALAKELNPSLRTFSVIYDEPSFDESYYSRLMADFLKTDHTELHISANDVKQSVIGLHQIIDEPMSDMSFVPTHILSKKAKEHVTVVLGGDGADEMFIGYPTQLAHKLTNYYTAIPSFIRKGIIEKAINAMPVSNKDFSLEFRLKRFIRSADMEPYHRHFWWQAHIPLSEHLELYSKTIDSKSIFNQYLQGVLPDKQTSVFNLIEYLDLSLYLSNDILSKVDIAAMASSLETRSPFLDFELVEFAHSLPEKLKFKIRNQKYILKKIGERLLPREIVYRKKHGFGAPIGKWLKNELHEHTSDLLTSNLLDKIFPINKSYIERILTEHKKGKKDNRKQIWSLTVLANWMISYGYA